MFRTRDGKFTKKAASFNNLIPFKSSTEPLNKDDCIVEGRRIVELSEIVHQLQEMWNGATTKRDKMWKESRPGKFTYHRV